jgi:hypothetical protein
LVPVVDRLRRRFGIGPVCFVADRGMISAATIAALEERGLEYILGVRERSSKEVRDIVLADPLPSVPLTVPHKGRPDTDLQAKEVRHQGRRYIASSRPRRRRAPVRPWWPACGPSSKRATRHWSATAPTDAT